MREHSGRPRRSGPGPGWWAWLRAWVNRSQRPANGRDAARPVQRSSYQNPEATRGGRGLVSSRAQRRSELVPYVVSLVVIVAVLGAFAYVGLDWATGRGRTLGLSATPTPSAVPSPSPVAVVPSGPSPSPVEQRVYVVRAGDTPDDIARQFDVSADALLRANGIKDPRTLQIGQTLKIPPPGTR